jgi:hypothetical protein
VKGRIGSRPLTRNLRGPQQKGWLTKSAAAMPFGLLAPHARLARGHLGGDGERTPYIRIWWQCKAGQVGMAKNRPRIA